MGAYFESFIKRSLLSSFRQAKEHSCVAVDFKPELYRINKIYQQERKQAHAVNFHCVNPSCAAVGWAKQGKGGVALAPRN